MFINKKSLTQALCAFTIIGTAGMNVAHADAQQPELIFSCTTDNNKVVSIHHSDGQLTYRYGKKGKPAEMTRTHETTDTILTPWNGVGFTVNQSIGFKNGATIYSVYSSYEREVGGKGSGGILVESGNSKNVNISCRADSMVDEISDFLDQNTPQR